MIVESDEETSNVKFNLILGKGMLSSCKKQIMNKLGNVFQELEGSGHDSKGERNNMRKEWNVVAGNFKSMSISCSCSILIAG
jgi:hypothetical protein